MWAFFISVLLFFSRKYYHFPVNGNKREKHRVKPYSNFVCGIYTIYLK
ncbi:hypothetical protein C823_000407 [Eubacterium plexicaudatum ASF492]|uniref:Uncharacterized protein n=1 Tax=Eubacterium plexicaudatum ASF492 TaxID=1235802 RepID=N2A7B5_9FIRM|nr:hypothetical protein C823_000407 [Eubacterium plexicaudatum ASF492]